MTFLSSLKKAVGLAAAATEEAADAVDTAIAANMPNVYSRAAKEELLTQKKEWGRKLVDAKARLKKEDNDVVVVQGKIDRIAAQLGEGGAYSREAYEEASKAKKSQIKSAATMLSSQKKELEEQLVREKKEAADALSRMERVEGIYDKFKEKLEDFDRQSQAMQDKLADADVRKQDAEMVKQEQQAMSGLSDAFSGLDKAFDGMNKAMNEAEKEAQLAEMEASEASEANGDDIEDLLSAAESSNAKESNDPWA